MKLEHFTEEEMRLIAYYCGDEAKVLTEVENHCYVFDIKGKYLYNECFEKANSDYFASKRYNMVRPIKIFEFAKYYVMKCEEYDILWFKGRLDANGNYEFDTNSDELVYLLESF